MSYIFLSSCNYLYTLRYDTSSDAMHAKKLLRHYETLIGDSVTVIQKKFAGTTWLAGLTAQLQLSVASGMLF